MSDGKKTIVNSNTRKNVSIDFVVSDFKKVVTSGKTKKLTSPSGAYFEMNPKDKNAQHQKSLSYAEQFNDVKLSG